MTATGRPSRLVRLARQAREEAEAQLERCELCSAPIPAQHRHVLDLRDGQLQCACRPCALLFDRDGSHSGHFRTVGDRRAALEGFVLDDERWAQTGIPVDMAFFVRSSTDGRVRALYPSPAGVTEATLDTGPWWEALQADNPQLAGMADDVEALLVDRVRTHRRQWIVPIDDAYRLVALVRSEWRGVTGGTAMWLKLEEFFDALPAEGGRKEAPWLSSSSASRT